MWPWHVKMPTQNLLRLLLLLMLMLRNVLTTVFADLVKLTFFRLWAHGLDKISKLKFRRVFEAECWSVFCCWCLVEVKMFNLGQNSEARFGHDFEVDVWSRFWRWNLIKICVVRTFDMTKRSYLGRQISILRLVVPLTLFQIRLGGASLPLYIKQWFDSTNV